MVIGTVQTLYEYYQLVNLHNHSDLSLKALDYVQKQFYPILCAVDAQTIPNSVKAKVYVLLARVRQWLREQ